MCASRKRFRPLDAAEERGVHARQVMQLALLDDERTYCYSWPCAPLTSLLLHKQTRRTHARDGSEGTSGDDAHAAAVVGVTRSVERLLGKSVTGGSSSSNADVSLFGRSAATATASSSHRQRVVLPPVYSARGSCSVIDDDDVIRKDVLRLLAPCTPRRRRGQRRHEDDARQGSNTAPLIGMHDTCDMTTAEDCGDGVCDASATCLRGSVEDSTLTLTHEQWRDVCRGGVLERVQYALSLTRAAAAAPLCTTHTTTTAAPSTSAAAQLRCVARAAVEREVVALEWQAYSEAQHTAAALQRLLTLDAAVPYTPSTTTLTPTLSQHKDSSSVSSSATGAATSAASARRAAQEASNVWRRQLYALWLRWRLCGGTLHCYTDAVPVGALTSSSHSGDGSCGGGMGDVAFVVQRGAHPWGTPLLAGAYLYGAQNDYFLHPQLALGTPAQAAQPHSTHDEGAVPTAARMRGGGKGVACASDVHSTATSTPYGAADTTRHRSDGDGPYSFLRWHVNRFLATTTTTTTQRARAMGGGSRRSGNSSSSSKARGGGNEPWRLACEGHDCGDTATQPLLLSDSAVEALVLQRVLQQPLTSLVDAEGESSDNNEAALRALACYDLQRETYAWRTWLAKA